MDYRVRWSKESRQDVKEIWRYIAADNRSAADRLRQAFFDRVKLLERLPLAGPRFKITVQGDIRQLVVGNYRIFYLVVPDATEIRILTVRHAARLDPEF
jgi:toxin ParE1/3/4